MSAGAFAEMGWNYGPAEERGSHMRWEDEKSNDGVRPPIVRVRRKHEVF